MRRRFWLQTLPTHYVLALLNGILSACWGRPQKQRDPEFAQLIEESERALTNKSAKKAGGSRTRKSEKQEDAELLAADNREGEDGGEDEAFVFTESPSCEFTAAFYIIERLGPHLSLSASPHTHTHTHPRTVRTCLQMSRVGI